MRKNYDFLIQLKTHMLLKLRNRLQFALMKTQLTTLKICLKKWIYPTKFDKPLCRDCAGKHRKLNLDWIS